jgi:hypothetical protein
MKKLYVTILCVILVGFLGYKAIYFKKLSEVSKPGSTSAFDFTAYADSLYYQGIMKSSVPIPLSQLMDNYDHNVDSAFAKYGNRLGIGNTAFFMVSDSGKVLDKTEEGFKVLASDGSILYLQTKFLFGNAIRDASKLVKLTDFKNNKEFNKVSEALNTLIREKVLPKQSAEVQKGSNIWFRGAIKLSKKSKLEQVIYPIEIKSGKALK